MSKGWTYISGDWNILCDVCSTKIKASISKQRWDGLITCPQCWEMRHPQDFIRTRTDKIAVPFSRRPSDYYVSVEYVDTGTDFCTPLTKISQAEFGTAGCATVGNWNGQISPEEIPEPVPPEEPEIPVYGFWDGDESLGSQEYGDEVFDDVILLLHGEGSEGSSTITDSSTYNRTPDTNIGTVITNLNNHIGNGSIHITSESDYIQWISEDFSYNNDDIFTAECYFYPVSVGNHSIVPLFTWWNNQPSTNRIYVVFYPGYNGAIGLVDSYNGNWHSSDGINLNVWHHVALVKNGTFLNLFLNGTLIHSRTWSHGNTTNNYFLLGANADSGSPSYNIYVDELRITRRARYTSDFIVPGSPKSFADEGCPPGAGGGFEHVCLYQGSIPF